MIKPYEVFQILHALKLNYKNLLYLEKRVG